MTTNYETIIGLEIHAQLKTASKMFCGCDNYSVESEPNTNVCPVCMGLPGVLPVANRRAIEWTILLGLALGAEIAHKFNFERKNYFYPDLPKAYQISSSTNPPVIGGGLEVTIDGEKKKIHLNHIHLEEDAGKLIHDQRGNSLVDLNRAGTPLVEIVTEPDLSSSLEAKIFMQNLRSLLRHLGISDANMEQGNLRCDANISIRKKGERTLGTKVEVKNINSFRMLEKAINYETARQTELVESGGRIVQETRGWDDTQGATISQRSKEEAQDYRYFPEPDIPPFTVEHKQFKTPSSKQENNSFNLNIINDLLPEMPDEKRARFLEEYGLSTSEAELLVNDFDLSQYFEATLSHIEAVAIESAAKKDYAKKLASWILTETMAKLKAQSLEISKSKVEPENMAELMIVLTEGKISGKMAKDIYEEMFATGKGAKAIIDERGLQQIGDVVALEEIVKKVISENPPVVADYKNGKEKALGFLVGKSMQITKGQANPQLLNDLFLKELKK